MFLRIILTGAAAGLAAGLLLSVIQAFTTIPLILEAETYENAAPSPVKPASAVGHGADEAAWAPADGFERSAFTALANILTAVGFGLLLGACFALWAGPVDGRSGVLWGIAGFAVFILAPALGLPPEAPGSAAAELGLRQGWWWLTVGATGLGLGLLVFAAKPWAYLLGIAAIVAPHVIGAPHADTIAGPLPAAIAGHFAAASIVTSGVFWAVLGWSAGTVFQRLEPKPR